MTHELADEPRFQRDLRVFRDVVQQDRDGCCVRDCAKMIHEPGHGEVWPEVRRRMDQHDVRSRLRQLLRQPGGRARRFGARSGHYRHRARQHVTGERRQPHLLLFVQQRAFAVRAEQNDAIDRRLRPAPQIVTEMDRCDVAAAPIKICDDGREDPLQTLAYVHRHASMRTRSSKSAGFVAAAFATSYETMSFVNRSVRCWSNVCEPYCSRPSAIRSAISATRSGSRIASRIVAVTIMTSTAATRPLSSLRGTSR